MRRPASRRPKALTQFHTYGDPGRDPRGNIVTVAYLAVTPDVGELAAGTDADDARLMPVARVIDGQLPLAFDHQRIVDDAVRYASERLEVGDLATAFVGPTFTLTELKSVYEAVWGEPLDAANFRRSLAPLADAPYVEPTGERSPPGPEGGRPPELFRASWRLVEATREAASQALEFEEAVTEMWCGRQRRAKRRLTAAITAA